MVSPYTSYKPEDFEKSKAKAGFQSLIDLEKDYRLKLRSISPISQRLRCWRDDSSGGNRDEKSCRP